jgi:hypothetical protein
MMAEGIGKNPDNQPPLIHENDYWYPGVGIDPAAYLLKPDQWVHDRPYITNGDQHFVFPVGVEGFQEQGQAQLGIHNYIGDNEADGVTVHFDESRITLSGTFPGLTGVLNMRELRTMLRSSQKAAGLFLWAPGVFVQEQYVLPDTWTFTHEAEDRSHSIDYSVTLLRIGSRGRVKDPNDSIPPENPGPGGKPGGKPARIFTVRAGYRTLRLIAKKVYHDADAWPRLVRLNQGQLNKWKRNHPNIPQHKIPTHRWPLGTKFRY